MPRLAVLKYVVTVVLLCAGVCYGHDSVKTVFAGTNLTLSCPGYADVSDPVTVTWSCRGCGRGQNTITVAQFNRDRSVTTLQDRIRLVVPNFQLQIYPVNVEDAGVYVCSINNAPSADSVRVIVEGVPRAPQRPLVVSFTSRSAELSWVPLFSDSDPPLLGYVIQKRRYDSHGPWDLQNEISIPDNRTSFNVTGLRPYVAYEFRVFAVNKVGRSLASEPSYPMMTHREVPSGKPTVIKTVSLGPDSIEVLWRPPDKSEMNGEFMGHVISYRARDRPGTDWTEIDLPGNVNQSTTYVLEGLTPFTEYLIRIQVKNMMGVGPYTVVKETTQEGVPGRPENLTHSLVGDTWALLSWQEPTHPNGIIVAYYLYLEFNRGGRNFTDSRIIQESDRRMTYNLTGLQPYTRYTIWLHAKASNDPGARSERLTLRTDVGGPSAPRVTNVTCQADTSLYIHWIRPETVHGSIDYYLIQYRSEYDIDYEEILVPTSYSVTEETKLLNNLTLNTMYEVRVVGVARSRFNESILYWGEMSPSRKVLLQRDCERIQYLKTLSERRTGWDVSSGMVTGVVCAVSALLLALLALFVWRRFFQASYNYLGDANKPPAVLSTSWETDSPDGQTGPVPVHLYPKHVAQLHADGDIGFSKEFEAVQSQSLQEGYTSDCSTMPENKHKNRYLNIVAYDHTRVQLQPLGSQKRPDYINANYIDGYQKPRAYIGTQGPLPPTVHCFWRMVWEQNVRIIVMITNLVEGGRKKCDMYWPQEGSETYGVIQVTAMGQDVLATYTIRKFRLHHIKLKKGRNVLSERIVYQYHYTNWPDHGIPESPLPILSFVRKSSAANPESGGPVVVHCSAGVGRTGTYIVLDSMMKMIRTRGELNVFGFLKYIRTQRNYLVQTEEQYIFLHDALLEAIESGETDIHCTFFRRYLHNLQTTEQEVYPWYNLERQYKLVTQDQASDYNMTSARHPVNAHKNRCGDLLPTESSRVSIAPQVGVECSNYINASWMLGFNRLNEFIVTQHPMSATVTSFWQMIWDHNGQTIVLLSPVDDQDFGIFWPLEHDDIDCDQFRVRFIGESQNGLYVLRDFSLISRTDEYELAVRIIQCSNWPQGCVSISHLFDLVRVVQRHHLEYQSGPCVVIDRLGGTEASTFCCLTTLMQQLEYESHTDVYMYARLYHTRRPGIWATQQDYLLLYQAVETLVAGGCGSTPLPPPPPPPPDVTEVQRQTLKPILKKGPSGSGHRHRYAAAGQLVRVPPDGMESTVVDLTECVT